VQIAVAAAHEAGLTARQQQRANAGERGAACSGEFSGRARRKERGILAERSVVLRDVICERIDPRCGVDHRGSRMSGRNTARELVRYCEIDCPRVGEVVERLRLVEAPHVDRPLDRFAVASECKVSGATARHRDDAAIKLRCEGPVCFDLGEARSLAPFDRREVEKGKLHRTLDLEGALAGQEHDPGVGVDAADGDTAVSRCASQKSEHVVLGSVLRFSHQSVRRAARCP
jgi:hypothetical protein